jgi:hypothetical protein
MSVFVFRKPLFISKLYRIYVCYMNITLYIAFGLIRGFTQMIVDGVVYWLELMCRRCGILVGIDV